MPRAHSNPIAISTPDGSRSRLAATSARTALNREPDSSSTTEGSTRPFGSCVITATVVDRNENPPQPALNIALSVQRRRSIQTVTAPCPACHAVASRVRFSVVTTRPFALRECATCGLVFAEPRPSPEELTAFYGASYFDTEARHGSGYFDEYRSCG